MANLRKRTRSQEVRACTTTSVASGNMKSSSGEGSTMRFNCSKRIHFFS